MKEKWIQLIESKNLKYFEIHDNLFVDTGSNIFPIKYKNYTYENIIPDSNNLECLFYHYVHLNDIEIVESGNSFVNLKIVEK